MKKIDFRGRVYPIGSVEFSIFHSFFHFNEQTKIILNAEFLQKHFLLFKAHNIIDAFSGGDTFGVGPVPRKIAIEASPATSMLPIHFPLEESHLVSI